jgi:hypothetical protein
VGLRFSPAQTYLNREPLLDPGGPEAAGATSARVAFAPMIERWRHWMRSDLIGVAVTAALAALLALTFVLFFAAGPLAGLFVGLLVVALAVYLVARLGGLADDTAGVGPPLVESAQRILVVANQGLANPALVSELEARAGRGPLEARLIAPVVASSRAQALADDIDAEAARAQQRLDALVGSLVARDIVAAGRVDDEAPPITALLDGLREFPADEVVLLPGHETDWEDAEGMAERIRVETGVLVTELRD